MSFIDLMASDIWTDADITNRTEAMVREQFSAQAEGILNRKITVAGMGAYTLSESDQAEVARFAAVTQAAAVAGAEARADMALLAATLAYEAALDRLNKPVFDGPETITDSEGIEQNNQLLAQDQDERIAAQAVIDAVSLPVTQLYALRHPVVVDQDVAPAE